MPDAPVEDLPRAPVPEVDERKRRRALRSQFWCGAGSIGFSLAGAQETSKALIKWPTA